MKTGSGVEVSRVLPLALTIAGFDPSGGAGVLADAQTFRALGCRAVAVITSITFQNSDGVFGALHQSDVVVREQLMPLLHDRAACVKTGMLPTRQIVMEVARLFRETGLPAPVVDPVIMSSSGQRLMEEDALEVLISDLLPLARVVTPNIPEAERLTSRAINSEATMREAAIAIRAMGARAVVIKGGHLKSSQTDGADNEEDSAEAIDVLDDEGAVTVFRERRVPKADLHGTGCIMSAAIAAGLATGRTLEDSVRAAKQFVLDAIRNASL
ncbi:MAG TPA: bifunctional hydroxymethylpyrimidine kinase/phosphomethylpyrimidine kinase [Pyrinomonadaceae bacterium]|nr:bifunctional hydroxymethylpyrimidine kinase/phosphomethylpyrimidine kinase [Pyrinomonadaceae bacterium]